MASLSLGPADLNKVRGSWADIMVKNHYKNDNLMTDLFDNLLIANPDLRPVFAKTAVRGEQQELFSELLNFTMMYLHNLPVLDECMNEFIKENPSLIRVGVNYLEPMGAVLIQTLRLSLGRDQFHAGLETLWIKVYIYIANCILQNDESDADSVYSDNVAKSSESETEEVEPLKVVAPSPYNEKPLPPMNDANSIKIDLSGNEKYKGFRRSITESPKAPVSVRVPASFMSHVPKSASYGNPGESPSCSPTLSATALESSFDPRPIRRRPSTDSQEPMLTPRSSRRNSAVQLHELGLENVDYEINLKNHNYDPRRKSNHRRTPSDLSANMESPERHILTSSMESPISEVDDDYKLANAPEDDQIDFSQTCKPRQNQVFDYSSFGIKGLAPIAESESDEEASQYSDNASSNYEAIVEKGSEDESSSRASSLSLHNLDYKSSISSGLAHSPVVDKTHVSKASQASEISFMQQLPQGRSPYMLNKAFLNSTPSFSSTRTGHQASLGFMRSSFILKKEMQDVGYNYPENVSVVEMPVSRSRSNQLTSRSVVSLPLRSELYGEFAPTPKTAAPLKAEPKKAEKSPAKEKRSFRKKLGSFFGSSSTPAKVSSKTISAPVSAPVSPTPKTTPSKKMTSNTSLHTSGTQRNRLTGTSTMATFSSYDLSNSTSNRVSSADFRKSKPAAPVGYAASVYLRPPTIDNASVHSGGSGTSGFSLFPRKKKSAVRYPENMDDFKINKYHVKKVAYKTVYVKDLIS